MLFSSLSFILAFLPVSVAMTWAAARLAGPRGAVALLLVASLIFYGWLWPPHVLMLLISIAANFAIGQVLWRRSSHLMLGVGVTFNLGLLAWFKYAEFLSETLGTALGLSIHVGAGLLPLGISFFTFQQIAYLVDIHRREARPHGPLDFAFFVSFFPQLIAGPIVHHRALVDQLSGDRFARFLTSDLLPGILLFSLGLAKKVLVADHLRFTADRLFEASALGVSPSFAEAWLGMLCYTFQIYFDFSGYSDMALGLGRMFGLRLPINFASPYKAASIVDFWHRWNMTLSQFLRDYLYVPLGGNRHGPVRRYANLWIVMLLGGLWHGASWSFVAWGGLHGFYLCINHLWRHMAPVTLPRGIAVCLTFAGVVFAWVFFRAETFGDAFAVLSAMIGMSAPAPFDVSLLETVAPTLALLAFAAAIVWCLPNSVEIVERHEAREPEVGWRAGLLVPGCAALAAFAIFNVFATGSYAFIYFQF